jgi:hypothetical protein
MVLAVILGNQQSFEIIIIYDISLTGTIDAQSPGVPGFVFTRSTGAVVDVYLSQINPFDQRPRNGDNFARVQQRGKR